MSTEQERADQSRKNGFYDGVILALQVMASGGNAFNAEYEELLKCAGVAETVERAIVEGMYELAGLDRTANDDMRKEIDRVRRKFTNRLIKGSHP